MADREMPLALSDDISIIVRVDPQLNSPKKECYAVCWYHPGRWKIGRYWPGSPAQFAPDRRSPIDIFYFDRTKEKLGRRRPTKMAVIMPVVRVIRSL